MTPPSIRDNKEKFVRKLFDGISPQYDFFNRISSFGLDQGWRRRSIAALKLLPGMRVLDVASGTGDMGILAVRELLPLGLVVGLDPSHRMLSFAKRKLAKLPVAGWHMALAQGKGEAISFSGGSFDAASIAFGMRNVSDLKRTFQELHRVLKSGGRVALLEFGRPKGFFFRIGQALWLSTGVPAIGILTTGKIWPFLYLRRSIGEFLAPEAVVGLLEQAGFRDVEAQPMTGGVVNLYTGRKF